MAKKVHQEWIKDEFSDEGEVGYFFDRNYSGGASVTLDNDGTLVFSGYNREVVIKNIGTKNEQVVVKNAADLVV